MKKFMAILEEKTEKWTKDVKVKGGKMHKVLGIDPADKISDHYTSGKSLANALTKAVGKSKAAKMLAFAANVKGGKDDIFDKALHAMKKIDEAVEDEEIENLDNSESDGEIVSQKDFNVEMNQIEDGKWEVTAKYVLYDEEEAEEFYNKLRGVLGLDPIEDETEIE